MTQPTANYRAPSDPSGQTGNQAPAPQATFDETRINKAAANRANSSSGFYAWLLSYTVIIVILAVINRTRIGHTIIYYSLALLLLLQLVLNYNWFVTALSPITNMIARNPTKPGSSTQPANVAQGALQPPPGGSNGTGTPGSGQGSSSNKGTSRPGYPN
jgi:hypothetical protein